MKKYRYTGDSPVVMPTLDPPRDVAPGDVIEVPDDVELSPDFEPVVPGKSKTPEPAED